MSQNSPSPVKLSLVAARAAQTSAILLPLGAILFLAAGRLDWWEAWAFLGVYWIIALAGAVWLLYHDPELSQERSRAGQDVKPWDRWLVALNLLLSLALFALIGLDAGRFGWSGVPGWVRVLGGLGLLLSFGLTLWASQVNTYLSARVRIQAERGHHAVTGGPYRFVRHPMYVGMILYDLSLPLLLGSWWALGISALMIVAVVVRTALEDRTLQVELPGYAEFTRQTRYRLLPGVW